MAYRTVAIVSLFCLSALVRVGGEPISSAGMHDVRSYNLGLGRTIFHNKCMQCHGNGTLNAPQLGKPMAWVERLQQDLPSLVQHAIDGHGQMPPKGGFDDLSEREVSAAVAYVVDQTRRIVAQTVKDVEAEQKKYDQQAGAVECTSPKTGDQCEKQDLYTPLLIQMFWLLSGQR